MKYPEQYSLGAEPEEIRVGDLVWWNEGVCVGYIEEVMEEREEYERNGLSEPSVTFTNLHPFEANERKHKQHIGFVTSGGSVTTPAHLLEDEGVGLLSDHERAELRWAISEANARAAPEHRDLPYFVSAVMDMDRLEEDWHFCFVDRKRSVLEAVVFPFRPNTRTEREPERRTPDPP